MKPEEIKVGDFVNLKLLVTKKYRYSRNDDGIKGIELESPTGKSLVVWADDFEALFPENGTKNADPAPKYDPCRPFKAGDIVTPCSVKGRWVSSAFKGRSGLRYIVTEDEDEDGNMWVHRIGSDFPQFVDAVYFQLVTPKGELEPYYLDTITTDDNNTKPYFLIKTRKHGHIIRTFYSNDFETIEQTKAAAEAECARLNDK